MYVLWVYFETRLVGTKMCAYSMVVDHAMDVFPYMDQKEHKIYQQDALRQRVRELEKLLERAMKYDQDNNQKDCPDPEKIKFLEKLEKITNVKLPRPITLTVDETKN